MENSSENKTQNTDCLLQQIVSELAALKDAESRKNKTARLQNLLYSCALGMILGVGVFTIMQQGGRLKELESNQIKIKQALQTLNGEISSELQLLDDLLHGEIPQDMQEMIVTEQVLLGKIALKNQDSLAHLPRTN